MGLDEDYRIENRRKEEKRKTKNRKKWDVKIIENIGQHK